MSQAQIDSTYDLVAAAFDRVEPRFFSYSGRRLVELARVPSGASVLDVGTGRGAILLPASQRVGRRGRAVGVDRSVGMVREAAKDFGQAGLGVARLCRMDAGWLGFADGSFDYVLCGHAIFHFPEAAREFHRVLKPGGQVGMTIVAKGCLDWVFELLGHYLPGEGPEEDVQEDAQDNEESMPITTPSGLAEVLSVADFEETQVVEEERDFVYADEAAWWSVVRTMGVRRALEMMDAGTVERFREELYDYVQAFKRPDGVHISYRVLYALASKAGPSAQN